MLTRRGIRVTGVVQGVGFRPFVHGLAHSLGLTGLVGNDDAGVFIEVQGTPAEIDKFIFRLRGEAPPLARVEAIDVFNLECIKAEDFVIVDSRFTDGSVTTVPPDSSVCEQCWRDVQDPANRRYRYPFTTCTHCGPRYTLITGLPYDRPQTTMAGFTMCDDCTAEYTDVTDRRFHAQPIACGACGPSLQFVSDSSELYADAALGATLDALEAGEIVAIKGVGGYHLACDADNPGAVRRLRERKGRGNKPFAVMLPTSAAADAVVHVDEELRELLDSRESPIVLAPARDSALVASVAPGQHRVGIMVAYSPLHRLLFEPHPDRANLGQPRALVMTSGNVADEPICTTSIEAQERLAHIADAFLHHDRGIHVACDDSVIAETGQPIRRSRGYTPMPLTMPFSAPPLLALGGELKTTVCLAQGERAWMSQHIGDTANVETLTLLERTASTLGELLRISPDVVVTDMHPGYLSRRWGITRAHEIGAQVMEVQHHHAHLASLLAEHEWPADEPVIGFTFDGTGFGADGDIWGGEILVGGYLNVSRMGHLAPVLLPGGDAAVKRPARTALAHLLQAGVNLSDDLPPLADMNATERSVVTSMLATGTHCTPTTSMGRLFDAVSSLLDVRHSSDYEGQAAIELEAMAELADSEAVGPGFALADHEGVLIADPAPLLVHIVDSARTGASPPELARMFHNAIADMVVAAAERISAETGIRMVGLTGGVFANRILEAQCQGRLEASGFAVLVHRLVPPNDGGLAFGQAAVAAAKLGG